MTTKQELARKFLESCGGFAEAQRLLLLAVDATVTESAGDLGTPAELSPALDAMLAACDALKTLDDATA